MAFDYRTPVESVLSRFTSEEQSFISKPSVNSIAKIENEEHSLFNFAMKPWAKRRLTEKGCYLSIYSYQPHSHPVCKTMENHLLYRVVKNYISEDFTIVSMKEGKVKALRHKTQMPTLEYINRYVTSKDTFRYGIDKYFQKAKKKVPALLDVDISSDTIKDLIPSCIVKKSRRFFLHDELHYWSTSDLDKFLTLTDCEVIVATHVYPKEVLAGFDRSLNPWAYTFRIYGSSIFFSPDGCLEESYQQPLDGGRFLTMGHFITSKGEIYTIDVVYTLFSHSVITITKGKLKVNRFREFSGFDATFSSTMGQFGGKIDDVIESRPELLKKIYMYLMTLKKPDCESAMAKLRQLVDDPSGFEVRFIQDFSEFLLKVKVTKDMVMKDFMIKVQEFLINCLPVYFRRKFSLYKGSSLGTFLESLEEFFVHVSVDTFDCNKPKDFVGMLEYYFESQRENLSWLLNIPIPLERARAPYSMSNVDVHVVDDRFSFGRKVEIEAIKRSCNQEMHFYQLLYGKCSTHDDIMGAFKEAGNSNALLEFYLINGRFQTARLVKRNILKFYHGSVHKLTGDLSIKMIKAPTYVEITDPKKTFGFISDSEYIDILDFIGDDSKPGNLNIEEEKRGTSPDEEVSKTSDKEGVKVCERKSSGLNKLVEVKKEMPSSLTSIFDDFSGIKLSELRTSEEELVPDVKEVTNDSVEASSLQDSNFEKLKLDDFNEVLFDVVCTINGLEGKNEKEFNFVEVEGDGNCFWHALCSRIGKEQNELRDIARTYLAVNHVKGRENSSLIRRVQKQLENFEWAENEMLFLAAATFDCEIIVYQFEKGLSSSYKPLKISEFHSTILLDLRNSHFRLMLPRNNCVLIAVSQSLNRSIFDILRVIAREKRRHLLEVLNLGQGLPVEFIEETMKLFGIEATISTGEGYLILNEGGNLKRNFSMFNDHLNFVSTVSDRENLKIAKGETVSLSSLIPKEIILSKLKVDPLNYKPSFEKAYKLQECFLKGYTGKILNSVFSSKKAWINADSAIHSGVSCYCVVGTFGSGKSFNVRRMILENVNQKFFFISPRRKLADSFRDSLMLQKKDTTDENSRAKKKGKNKEICKNCRCLTFEVAFSLDFKKDSIIIIDEMQLFPPGYLDLLCYKNREIERIVILGDPSQSSYDNSEDRLIFGGVQSDLHDVLRGQEYKFLILSRRFLNPFFEGRLPSMFSEFKMDEVQYAIHDSFKDRTEEILAYDCILTTSFEEKKMVTLTLGNKVPVLTFGESTGLTFNTGAILLTQSVRIVDQRRMLVALSRFRKEINFINQTGEDFKEFILSVPNSFLYKFCTRTSFKEDLLDYLPGNPKFVVDLNCIGTDEVDREERVAGDPWLKTMIFLGARPNPQTEVEVDEDKVFEKISFKVHQPIINLHSHIGRITEEFRAKENREMRIKDLITEQFRDSYFSKDVRQVSNQCDLFEAIYPRHKAGDTATFLMAVKKRLSFDDPIQNGADLKKNLTTGKIMLKVFLNSIPIKNSRNEAMLEEAVNDFEVKKLSKSKATIENHAGRSSRDWNIREAFIFMKSQLCSKFEKRFTDAKAGQTLACFSHIVLARFAPWIRYIEKKVFEVLPKRFYIHSGKNFDDLNSWVTENSYGGFCTESDYEAFDASQDSNILAFEVELMKYLQIPNDVIEDYILIKLNLYSKLGNFSVMRFTGEAGTFLFNTLANMTFTFMRYDLNGSESICFAGDDMCANKPLKKRGEYEVILNKLKLKAKVDIKKEATFCGWVLGDFGIYKKPQLVLERFEIAEEHGNLDQCLENYAIEVSYGYRLGDKILDILNQEEQECQFLCVRKIVKNSHKLRSDIANLYKTLKL
ncbi:TPA_asm: replicase [Date palm-associated virus A]|nr:TPA_asm: replicase [Date palm-associated virus A]